MNVEKIEVGRAKAKELYRAYKTHQHYQKPIDHAIQRAYQLIAQGRVIIKALESIKVAGVNEQGFPKLAICNAAAERCRVELRHSGTAEFTRARRYVNSQDRTNVFRFPAGSFPTWEHGKNGPWSRAAEGIVPIVPIHLRPKRALANYHVLWEAEWTQVVPKDPYLLRRLSGDMWLVVAAWDLTEVERAALATRLSA